MHSEDSDQPACPRSLIRVFADHSAGSQRPKACSNRQRWFWSVCAEAKDDMNLHWAHESLQEMLCPDSYLTRLLVKSEASIPHTGEWIYLHGRGRRRVRKFYRNCVPPFCERVYHESIFSYQVLLMYRRSLFSRVLVSWEGNRKSQNLSPLYRKEEKLSGLSIHLKNACCQYTSCTVWNYAFTAWQDSEDSD